MGRELISCRLGASVAMASIMHRRADQSPEPKWAEQLFSPREDDRLIHGFLAHLRACRSPGSYHSATPCHAFHSRLDSHATGRSVDDDAMR